MNNKPVSNQEIAELMPVGEWFPRRKFITLTGMREKSAIARLSKLVRGGFLAKKGRQKESEFKISIAQHLLLSGKNF